tara:strand:+ start:896 stop:1357 length:462 start_codon:yes stop_codon:yes gene_type:complete
MSFIKKLNTLNIDVTNPPKVVGSYLAYRQVGKFIYVSGQLPFRKDGTLIKGKLGLDMTIEQGQEAAKICTVNIISQVNLACGGDIDKVKNCIKITGFVNSTDSFVDQPKVINGASELLVEIFGDNGKHARAAVSVNSLPLGVAVEIEAIFEIN